MGRVDFHVLSADAPDARLRHACRLAEQAFDAGTRVYIQTMDVSEAQRIDELLWTYSDRTFLPHELLQGPAPSDTLVRILIGDGPAPAQFRDLLINLAEALPADLDSFQVIAEIVDVDPERKRRSRERYKQYRDRGCSLATHNV